MNTNPTAKRILCFGDSNTWGYIPGTKHDRYPSNIRWTGVLQNLLENDFEVIEEGLNSRRIASGDPRPGKEGRNAMEYIIPCLNTHDPLDHIVILLGTNDTKADLNLSAQEIGENMRKLVNVIAFVPSQFKNTKLEIIIVVPGIVNEETEYALLENKFKGSHDKSVELASVYEKIAQETNCKYLNIQDQLIIGSDGIHFMPEGHEALAKELVKFFK